MENFDEFAQEAVAEIKRNPHLYPIICRGMVEKLDRLTAERDRYKAEAKEARHAGRMEALNAVFQINGPSRAITQLKEKYTAEPEAP